MVMMVPRRFLDGRISDGHFLDGQILDRAIWDTFQTSSKTGHFSDTQQKWTHFRQ